MIVSRKLWSTDGEISKKEVNAGLQEEYNECDDLKNMQQRRKIRYAKNNVKTTSYTDSVE